MDVSKDGTIQVKRVRPGGRPTFSRRPCPPSLGIDRLAENLSSTLLRTGARAVDLTMPNKTVRLAVEEDKIGQAFAALGDVMPRGADVTIVGDLLRIQTDGTDENTGCALLSVSVTGGQTATKRVVRDALSGVRGAVRTQSGFLRFWEGRGKIRLSLYLPVVHSNKELS